MRIQTNTTALNAYKNLSVNDSQMSKSLEKLSSGFRINRAADDAAGLAISEGLRSQIGGLKQAVRNTQDGISVVQTAEGALAETTSILQRMRDLSVQAANDGGLSAEAKGNIQAEVGQLKDELNRIASSTTFNGKKLLDGSFNASFQVGANQGQTISINLDKAANATALGVAGVNVTGTGNFTASSASGTASTTFTTAASGTTAGSIAFTAATGSANAFTTAASGTVGAFQKLDGTISFAGKTFDLGSVDYSNADSDNNAATAPTADQALAALNKAAKAVFGFTGDAFVASGTGGNTLTFKVPTGESVAGYTGSGGAALTSGPSSTSTAADYANATPVFTAATGASAALKAIDTAIQTVSTTRANLGALQNRFDHTIANLNTAVENLSESESRIRDTDMAMEMANFSKSQILVQAGTSMLAQANSASQSVLKLLQ
ncbi:flagellin [Klenkia sp. LSe6-5]|uniref:Flagellin n=1 Tax=Klenkia sesuvii TaxID=3103137 RepID=A0ABU8DPI3_9ACTN